MQHNHLCHIVVALSSYSLALLYFCHHMNLTAWSRVIYMLTMLLCQVGRSVCDVMFLGSMCRHPILSVRILTVINMFSFGLIHFRFLVNPIFVPIPGRPDFDFVSILKCKSANRRGFIPTSPIRFHP